MIEKTTPTMYIKRIYLLNNNAFTSVNTKVGRLQKMAAKKFRIRISADECKGCARCIPACPKSLIKPGSEINIQGYVAVETVTPEACVGCGACFYQCPEPGAITIFEIEE